MEEDLLVPWARREEGKEEEEGEGELKSREVVAVGSKLAILVGVKDDDGWREGGLQPHGFRGDTNKRQGRREQREEERIVERHSPSKPFATSRLPATFFRPASNLDSKSTKALEALSASQIRWQDFRQRKEGAEFRTDDPRRLCFRQTASLGPLSFSPTHRHPLWICLSPKMVDLATVKL